jgi:membrane fusion protein, peptide pheromone/bacteriocin exporter
MELIPSSYSSFTLESYLTKVSSRSRVIYWIIILSAMSGIILLPFIYVDVTVQARGYFQSDTEKQVIYAPFQGKVVLANINNGTAIKTGDTLLVIESETLKAQKRSIQKQIAEKDQEISDLEILVRIKLDDSNIQKNSFRTERYFSGYSRMLNSIAIQNQKCLKAKSELERNRLLHEELLIPDSEYENIQFSYNTENENLHQIFNSEISKWNTELSERKNENTSLVADLESCLEQMKNRVIVASMCGEIISSSEIQPGTIVNANQQVAQFSPEGPLVANCFIKPGDIGLIKEGQLVLLQVDAFNYNEWGLIHAKIEDISDDIITDDVSNAFFRIICVPEKTTLSLKNGIAASLKKGMSLNARIIINRRSLFNLLFDKIDKWINPYSNKKG